MTDTRLRLTTHEKRLLGGEAGAAIRLAMRIVVRMGEILGARELVRITSAHIDGCLYHGDGGVEFAERLVELGGRVSIPATLNVGALDLLNPARVRASDRRRAMALRQMNAYRALGCTPTWTCAPYQAGHRPAAGDHVAWGESNAVAFANSVLGARTNRYGDFMDICCALTGRAPRTGLHLGERRRATVVVDTEAVAAALKGRDVFYPVLGTWLGRVVGDRVAVVTGLPASVGEDQLKAMGAAAASSGAVGLFHVAGVTPEAPDRATALGGHRPEEVIALRPDVLRAARDTLSTAAADRIDAVAVGSPHFSLGEFAQLEALLPATSFAVPFYICTGRSEYARLDADGRLARFVEAGVEIVVDTCVVVTPILPPKNGVLMTNSGKFAHYTPSNTGYGVVYGSLEDCVRSAIRGRVRRDESLWS
ncbi:MAG: aconitase X catalytic domain-containing protein [Gemmatimonadota bacterium]|nr:aconitase X catalytic domain-containing protein [Gemmatimonadota bacterium]MDE2984473.1 aconitase X catalytic domain-containing protein [Gemmatimonadota bacterium]